MTKDTLRQALAPIPAPPAPNSQQGVLWASVCDTYASVRVAATAQTPTGELNKYASAARQAAANLAAQEGARLDSFIVEFVDAQGAVIHTTRFGGMNQPAPQQAPQQSAPSAPQGHNPIPGLRPNAAQPGTRALPSVQRIIAVGAGKGGVGKSTIALNLAVGLARRGHSVGILDADIYGPSMPTMLGLASLDAVVHSGMLQPFYTHGVKCMTIGKLVDADKPLIWRGPMAHGAFKQLTEQTQWGELDYLIIDLPPGTGDIALSMAQTLQLTGAVVVCTPQKVAQDDAVRAAKMFQQLGVRVLGVVENMSYFVGDDGKTYDLFGRGGAQHMAQRLGVPFLGEVPITMSLRISSDKGDPTSNFTGSDDAGKRLKASLEQLVQHVESHVALAEMGTTAPTLTIS